MRDIKAVEVEFHDANVNVGVMISRQHILQILFHVFQDLQLTAHFMRSEILYEYSPIVLDDILATYNAKSNLDCNQKKYGAA